MPGIKRKRSDKDVPNDAQREMVNDINNLSSSWRRRLGLHPAPSDEGMIRLVSDCAGYGSDLIALRLLDLQNRFQVVMTSEVAKDKRILHSSVATACGWSDGHGESVSDIMTRNDLTAPRADLYVAGYPCPSFSRLGKRQGARDQRGFVTLKGLKYIAASRPRALILEQVSELQQAKHKRVWEFIQKILTRLNYAFVWKVLSPKHFAVPQSRPRTYVVAVARESLRTRELTLLKGLIAQICITSLTKPWVEVRSWTCQCTRRSWAARCGKGAGCWTWDHRLRSNIRSKIYALA